MFRIANSAKARLFLFCTDFVKGGYNSAWDWNSFACFFQKIFTFDMF